MEIRYGERNPKTRLLLLGIPSFDCTLYGGITGPSNFGTGGNTNALSGAGGRVGLYSDAFIAVPVGYTSDTAYSSSTSIRKRK